MHTESSETSHEHAHSILYNNNNNEKDFESFTREICIANYQQIVLRDTRHSSSHNPCTFLSFLVPNYLWDTFLNVFNVVIANGKEMHEIENFPDFFPRPSSFTVTYCSLQMAFYWAREVYVCIFYRVGRGRMTLRLFFLWFVF